MGHERNETNMKLFLAGNTNLFQQPWSIPSFPIVIARVDHFGRKITGTNVCTPYTELRQGYSRVLEY